MKKSAKTVALIAVVLLVSLSMFAACSSHSCSFENWTTLVEATHTTTGLKQAICSCGETKLEEIPKTEVHAYSAWTTLKESTCTEEGLEERVCVCGEKESRTISAIHDTLEGTVVTEATCEEDGLKAFVCATCEQTITEEIIPATGHTAKTEWSVEVEADCVNDGVQHLNCADCDALLEISPIPATGHSFGAENDGWVLNDDKNCKTVDKKTRVCLTCGHTESEDVPASHKWEVVKVITAATCTTDGLDHCVCVLCAAEEDIVVTATGHSYEWVTTDATCTAGGIKEDKCAGCGDVRATELIEATGHNYLDVVDVEATCTMTGKKHQECDACGDVLKGSEEVVPVLDHDFVDWRIVLEATCVKEGKQERFCCCCGAKEESVIEKLEHVYGWAHATEKDVPTCTVDGKLSWMCELCGDVQGTMPDKATGHDYAGVVTDPTCTEKGFTTYTCTVCDDKYVDDWTDPAGHAFGHANIIKDATCVAPGEQVSWCSICNEKNTEEIPVIDHVYEWKVTTPATCLTAGEEKNICVCGKFIATRVIDALGHNMGEAEVETAATCTKDGVSVQSCLNDGCKHQVKDTIKAGHKWTETLVLTAPTCTAEGKAVQYCTVCKIENSVVIDKIDHNMAWIEKLPQVTANAITWKDTKATCAASGHATYKCTECDYYTDNFKVTERLPHTPAEDWVIADPTCTANGKAQLHCVDCNAVLISKIIPATGHVDIKWVEDSKTGITNYICTCGKVFDKMSTGLTIKDNALISVGSCKATVIYLPTTVTKICAGAFDSCKTITTIYLPAGLTEIGENAFRDCSALTDIYFDGSNAAWNAVAKNANWDKNTGNYTVH